MMWFLCPDVRLGFLGFASIYCRKRASALGLVFWVWAGTIRPVDLGPGWVSLRLPGPHSVSSPMACKTCKVTWKLLTDVNKTMGKRKALPVPCVCKGRNKREALKVINESRDGLVDLQFGCQ